MDANASSSSVQEDDDEVEFIIEQHRHPTLSGTFTVEGDNDPNVPRHPHPSGSVRIDGNNPRPPRTGTSANPQQDDDDIGVDFNSPGSKSSQTPTRYDSSATPYYAQHNQLSMMNKIIKKTLERKYDVDEQFAITRRIPDSSKPSWQLQERAGQSITIAKPANPEKGREEKALQIEAIPNGFKMSGIGGNANKDVGKMAVAMKQSSHMRNLRFTVNADSIDEAKAFMKDLASGGFDVRSVSVKIADNPKQSFGSFVAQLPDKSSFQNDLQTRLQARDTKNEQRSSNRSQI